MIVLLIHLQRATHRTAHVAALQAQAAALGAAQVRVLPAVDGRAADRSLWEAHVRRHVFAPPYPFALNPGELGCFLSHRLAWQTLLDSDQESALILEDDAVLDAHMAIRALALRQATDSYVQLQSRAPTRALKSALSPQRQAFSPPPLRTSAQWLTRRAARMLLQKSPTFDRPIDAFLQLTWQHGVPIQTLYPSGISEATPEVSATTIQTQRQKSLWKELPRAWQRQTYRNRIKRQARRSALLNLE